MCKNEHCPENNVYSALSHSRVQDSKTNQLIFRVMYSFFLSSLLLNFLFSFIFAFDLDEYCRLNGGALVQPERLIETLMTNYSRFG